MEQDPQARRLDLGPFFEPRGVALVGARRSPGFGYGTPIVLKRQGWEDRLYLVNPKGGELHGMKVYESLADVPDPVDLAVIIVPAPAVPDVIEKAGQRGIRHAIIESAGFAEVGPEGRALQDKVLDAARRNGIRIIGPNCVGVVNTSNKFSTVEVIDEAMAPGPVAVIAQSGVFGTVLLDMLHHYGLTISKAVTLGNRMDITESDVLDYFSEDPATRVVMMYLEGAADGRRLRESLEAITPRKPVLVLKTGRTAQGSAATASHTASLSGEDQMYDALFKQTGTIRADTLEELVEMSRAFATQQLPKGRRLGIVTSSGSLGVMATDAAVARGLEVPELSEFARDKIKAQAPAWMNVRNPVDVGPSPLFAVGLEALLEDPDIDMVLAITVLPYVIFKTVTMKGSDGRNWFGDIGAIRARFPGKPFIQCSVGHNEFVDRMKQISGPTVPVYVAPEPAVKALAALYQRAK
jgi:acyl-CoA synthetase (NDP forming)